MSPAAARPDGSGARTDCSELHQTDTPLIGVLLLDKPVGPSSNGILQRVRRLAGRVKAGHAGSLDPLASGMLPICLGEATKLAGQLLAGRKAYRFTLQLGERTATGDAEGEVVERRAVPALSAAQVQSRLQEFVGARLQQPPMFSALKHGGEPLYRLARAGRSVTREPRAIRIDQLELCGLHSPQLQLRVLCSKGTYVRVLAEEIAGALGTCGRLQGLRREYVEPFAEEPMHSIEQLEAWRREGVRWPLLAPDRAVVHLPALQLSAQAAEAIGYGVTVLQEQAAGFPAAQLWRLYDPLERFLGLGVSDVQGRVRARRLLSRPLAGRLAPA